jgi:hypothetical protein
VEPRLLGGAEVATAQQPLDAKHAKYAILRSPVRGLGLCGLGGWPSLWRECVHHVVHVMGGHDRDGYRGDGGMRGGVAQFSMCYAFCPLSFYSLPNLSTPVGSMLRNVKSA